jgi:hypothetical protein
MTAQMMGMIMAWCAAVHSPVVVVGGMTQELKCRETLISCQESEGDENKFSERCLKNALEVRP